MMSQRENILRSISFERPERIPMVFWINPACRNHYPPSVLDDLQESHPYLFPGFRRPSEAPAAPKSPVQSAYVDAWGVTMASPEEGHCGSGGIPKTSAGRQAHHALAPAAMVIVRLLRSVPVSK